MNNIDMQILLRFSGMMNRSNDAVQAITGVAEFKEKLAEKYREDQKRKKRQKDEKQEDQAPLEFNPLEVQALVLNRNNIKSSSKEQVLEEKEKETKEEIER